jgi:carbon-monoxide dehydrogenase medium subunit
MHNFNYQKASSVADAASKLGAASDGKLLAGGMTLLATMKQRLASPSDLVDLAKVGELKGITMSGGTVTIGAMTTHNDVASNADVKKAIPALAKLASGIGDPAVRYRGTIGGSIANSDPAADYPAAVVGLGATIKTNKREIAGDQFFKGLFETALQDGEIITSVSFPVPEKSGYQKFPNPASRFALVGVFVSKKGNDVRVGVTGAGPCAFRAGDIERALGAKWAPDAAEGVSIKAAGLNSDIHASAEYRAHLVKVMAKRAVAEAG